MVYTLLIVFGVIILLVLLLTRISPYNSDFTLDSFVINDDKIENVKYVEVEKIVEKPVEIIKEVIIEKPIEKIEVFEDLDRIHDLEERIKELENLKTTIWRNIGLELYQETNLDKFVDKLNSIIGKKILIVTDSSYVLGANFKDHKTYTGVLTNYEVLTGRYPDQPIVKFNINVPVLSTTTVNLSWVFDKYRFDPDFSSSELVADYLKTNEPKNELLLVES